MKHGCKLTLLYSPPLQRRYFLSRSACHRYFLSGKLSGILILRKSWMHFSSSSSTVIVSLAAGRFLQLVSLALEVSVRSRSLFLRCCCSARRCCCSCCATEPPFLAGRSSVWTTRLLTGPRTTVPRGELASDWLSELEVERSLQEVALSPSAFLQQQSHGDEVQRVAPPAGRRREE